MSYIEKKYLNKINELFETELPQWEDYLLELLNKRSIKIADNTAKVCAELNKNVNIILRQYYPKIKDMEDKLRIKSFLKFYFDLIDSLTNFIRNIENFQKIDDNYYNLLIEFIEDKENLIYGKYRSICTQELTIFYDPVSRENLEKIINEKFEKRSRQFFTFGSLEEEVKKIAKIAGAEKVEISIAETTGEKDLLESAESIITYSISLNNKDKLKEVGEKLKNYLESKDYSVKILENSVVTNAKLLPDS